MATVDAKAIWGRTLEALQAEIDNTLNEKDEALTSLEKRNKELEKEIRDARVARQAALASKDGAERRAKTAVEQRDKANGKAGQFASEVNTLREELAQVRREFQTYQGKKEKELEQAQQRAAYQEKLRKEQEQALNKAREDVEQLKKRIK